MLDVRVMGRGPISAGLGIEFQIEQQTFLGGVSKLSRRIMSFMNHVN